MCKRAHFGNCDPETADQEYCIFHKPNKSEDEAVEFYQKFLEKFKPRVEEIEVGGQKVKMLVFERYINASGFVFPESPKGFSLFKYALFKERCDFTEAVFEEYADFTHAEFYKDADFMFAKFKQGASFRKAHFEKADFRVAEFYRHTKFNDATLKEGFFDEATFNGTTEFLGTIFGNAGFNGAKFKQHTYFRGSPETGQSTTFEGQATFKEAEFHGKAYFKDVVFQSSVNFETVFKEEANFTNVKFNGDKTSFARSTFKGVAHFEFAEFGKVIFNFAVFEKEARFINATFYDEARFGETKFREPVAFHGAVFCKDVKFESTFFESIAEFPKAIFLKSADFNGAIFNNKTNFKETFFNGDAVFRDAAFRVSVDFSGKPGEKELRTVRCEAQLKKIPINSGYKFVNRVDFSHADVTAMKFVELCKTPLDSHDYETFIQEFVGLFRIPEAITESARIQRVSFEKEGKREEADRMFVLEMRTRRKLRKSILSENAVKKATSIWGIRQLLRFQDMLVS